MGGIFHILIAKVKSVAMQHQPTEWDAARKSYKLPSAFGISGSIPIIYGFPIATEVFRQ